MGKKITIGALGVNLTADDALNLAAWLVAMAQMDASPGVTFEQILEEVENS